MVLMEPLQMPTSTEEWKSMLIGRTLVDTEEAAAQASTSEIFPISQLPEPKRIIKPRDPVTENYISHRLNIFITEDMKVTDCYYG